MALVQSKFINDMVDAHFTYPALGFFIGCSLWNYGASVYRRNNRYEDENNLPLLVKYQPSQVVSSCMYKVVDYFEIIGKYIGMAITIPTVQLLRLLNYIHADLMIESLYDSFYGSSPFMMLVASGYGLICGVGDGIQEECDNAEQKYGIYVHPLSVATIVVFGCGTIGMLLC